VEAVLPLVSAYTPRVCHRIFHSRLWLSGLDISNSREASVRFDQYDKVIKSHDIEKILLGKTLRLDNRLCANEGPCD